jgi:hypothetical protein
MLRKAADFESAVSTNSTTGAHAISRFTENNLNTEEAYSSKSSKIELQYIHYK